MRQEDLLSGSQRPIQRFALYILNLLCLLKVKMGYAHI
ncbi:unnamed protein product [Leptidea sinapis]|uniref:Uncharacterized protein n=1 Tax=Leptidea sinapis TaxID=189913 RepID=A0A5E4PKQ8_9NEOP|nr:unnamed protein product [Leptidea sinapis]